MTWLVWRQHRSQLLFGAAALATFAVLLPITGLQLASKYHSALASCTVTKSCGDLASTLSLGDAPVFFLVTPDHGRAGPARAVLGRAAGGQRNRDGHQRLRLDAERHPQALAPRRDA
jgi:hypothetical protein